MLTQDLSRGKTLAVWCLEMGSWAGSPGSRVSVIISQFMFVCQRRAPLLERSRVGSWFQALTWEQQGKGSSKHLASVALPKRSPIIFLFGDGVIYGPAQQQRREVQCSLSRSLVALQCSLCDREAVTIALPFNDFVAERWKIMEVPREGRRGCPSPRPGTWGTR